VLLKDNISTLSQAISPKQLPKTFADAIEITRKLGIDYIWIDSLCIIQDDEDDWRRESALMEHVYGGSYLNIAASSATSVHGGCWVKSDGMQNAFRTKVKVRGSELVREIRDDDCYDQAVWDSHLATRAWALQEKLLPPRTLHLGDRGAFWECRHKIANEYLPDGFTHRLGSGLLRKMRKLEYLQSWWAEVVRLYTGADLTFARDKLPALSGVARRIHGQKGGQYLAGLWRAERIEAQLCWRVDGPRIRPAEWRAPSWSWASVDGPVFYTPTQPGICDETYAHVVDASVTPLAGDVFGQLSAGRLDIACTGIIFGRVTGSDKMIVQGVEEDFECPIYLDALDEARLSQDVEVCLLPLTGGKTGTRSRGKGETEWFEPKLVQGLVLRRTGGGAGEFYRIGAFKCVQAKIKDGIVDRESDGDAYHELMRKFEASGKETARSVCAKVSCEAEGLKEFFNITVV
jgi:hypothetical protein